MPQHLFVISTNGKQHDELSAPSIGIEVSASNPLVLVLHIEGHGQVEVFADELDRAIQQARHDYEAKRWG